MKPLRPQPTVTQDWCSGCQVYMNLDCFSVDMHRLNGRCPRCKKCQAETWKRGRTGKKKFPRHLIPKVKENEKFCTACQQIKLKAEFNQNRGHTKDGFIVHCKKCMWARVKTVGSTAWWTRRLSSASHNWFQGLPIGVMRKRWETGCQKCEYCRAALELKDVHFEHQIPKSRGGKNTVENIAFACEDCNRMKHDRTDAEFREFLKEYVTRFKPENIVKLFPLAEYTAKETQA